MNNQGGITIEENSHMQNHSSIQIDENSNTMNLDQYKNIEITEPVQNAYAETTMK